MPFVRALVRRGGSVALVERPRASPGAGQVALCVEAAGVCRTDLAVADGRFGREGIVLGHECAGRVRALGAGVEAAWLRQRVVVWPFVGDEQLGVVRDGVFADECVVDVAQLSRVPEALDPRVSAMFEPVAAALAVEEALVAVPRDATVVLLGRNRIATLLERVLRACGRPDIRIEGEARSLQDAHAVVETVADHALLSDAIESVRPGAVIVLKSRGWGPRTLPLDRIVERSLVLRGAYYGSREAALALLGTLPLLDLVGPSFALEEWPRAFEAARADDSTKVFLLPGGA